MAFWRACHPPSLTHIHREPPRVVATQGGRTTHQQQSRALTCSARSQEDKDEDGEAPAKRPGPGTCLLGRRGTASLTRLNSLAVPHIAVQEPVRGHMGDRPAQTHTEGFMRSILPLSGGKDLPGQGPLAAGPDVAALAQRWLPNHALDDGSQPAGSGGRRSQGSNQLHAYCSR